MTKMPSTFKYQKKVWSLFALIGVLVASYVILVGMTMYNTLSAQRAERDISIVTADLSKMEFAYLSKQGEINMDLASSLGFVEPENVVVAKVATLNETAFVTKNKI